MLVPKINNQDCVSDKELWKLMGMFNYKMRKSKKRPQWKLIA